MLQQPTSAAAEPLQGARGVPWALERVREQKVPVAQRSWLAGELLDSQHVGVVGRVGASAMTG